jgi:hypothetical protein
VHALCNVSALLTNGLLRLGEQAGEPEESFTEEYVRILFFISYFIVYLPLTHCSSSNRQRREHRVFDALLQMVPGLEDRLLNGAEEDVMHVAEMV